MSIRHPEYPNGPLPRPGFNAAWRQIILADKNLANEEYESAQTAVYQASRILYELPRGEKDYYMAVAATVFGMINMGIFSICNDWKLNQTMQAAPRILIPRSQVTKFIGGSSQVDTMLVWARDEYFTTRPKFFEVVWKRLDPSDMPLLLASASRHFEGAIKLFANICSDGDDGPFMLAREGMGRFWELKGQHELARKCRASGIMLCSNPDCANKDLGYTSRIPKFPSQLFECPTCKGSFFCGPSCSQKHDLRCSDGQIDHCKWLAPGELPKVGGGIRHYKPFYFW